MLQISDKGLGLIGQDKSFAAKRAGSDMLWPYMDIVGVWTIGAGHVIVDANGNRFVGAARAADVAAIYPNGLSLGEGQALLRNELRSFEAAVNKLAAPDTTQSQFDALVSFSYNEGNDALQGSTVLRLHNSGKRTSTLSDADARTSIVVRGNAPTNAADALFEWNKVRENGQLVTSNGLVNRRSSERTEYLTVAVVADATVQPDPAQPDAVTRFWSGVGKSLRLTPPRDCGVPSTSLAARCCASAE